MKKKIILWVLLFSWMGVIFLFSTQDGTSSAHLSSGLVHRFVLFFLPKHLSGNENLVSTLEFIVRKGAHMTEYAILAMLALAQIRAYFPWKNDLPEESSSARSEFALSVNGLRPLFQLGITVGFVFLYACTDEFHQTFISGRSGQFRDVLIDTAGGLLGGLVFLLLAYLIRTMKLKTKLKK